jgi:hypothetical protein
MTNEAHKVTMAQRTLAEALATLDEGAGLAHLSWQEIDRLAAAVAECIHDAAHPERAGAVALVLLQHLAGHLRAELQTRNAVAAAAGAAPRLQ